MLCLELLKITENEKIKAENFPQLSLVKVQCTRNCKVIHLYAYINFNAFWSIEVKVQWMTHMINEPKMNEVKNTFWISVCQVNKVVPNFSQKMQWNLLCSYQFSKFPLGLVTIYQKLFLCSDVREDIILIIQKNIPGSHYQHHCKHSGSNRTNWYGSPVWFVDTPFSLKATSWFRLWWFSGNPLDLSVFTKIQECLE